jgi:hypothetical protein
MATRRSYPPLFRVVRSRTIASILSVFDRRLYVALSDQRVLYERSRPPCCLYCELPVKLGICAGPANSCTSELGNWPQDLFTTEIAESWDVRQCAIALHLAFLIFAPDGSVIAWLLLGPVLRLNEKETYFSTLEAASLTAATRNLKSGLLSPERISSTIEELLSQRVILSDQEFDDLIDTGKEVAKVLSAVYQTNLQSPNSRDSRTIGSVPLCIPPDLVIKLVPVDLIHALDEHRKDENRWSTALWTIIGGILGFIVNWAMLGERLLPSGALPVAVLLVILALIAAFGVRAYRRRANKVNANITKLEEMSSKVDRDEHEPWNC